MSKPKKGSTRSSTAEERDAIPTTPALDDELDEDLEAETAPITESTEPTEDAPAPAPEPEPVLTIPTRSAAKAAHAGKAKYTVWEHGALQLNGVTYAPGEPVFLSAAQAESIGECVALAES